ncbi:NUDIX domain-containing protein [Acanthopleuribacter pedis]|uniref:NUDIX domain-containing protein n=1 Tax=Acanthopleuribacter pedis TaxID=442870 RepID=UPI001A9D9E72|nr:NUDIX domain-containing protein [Acanthopleuribacter pedis]
MEFREPRVADRVEPLCRGVGPFRPNAAALIVRRIDGRIETLMGERLGMPGVLHWPQGGIEEGETPEEALQREVAEEIGVAGVDLLYRFPFGLRYRFPESMGEKFYPRVGQEQTYFIVTLRDGDPPCLERVAEPEFRYVAWLPLSDAAEAAVWFKRPLYETVIDHALSVLPDLLSR